MSARSGRLAPPIPRWVFATVIAIDAVILLALIVFLALVTGIVTIPSEPVQAPVPGTIQYLHQQEDTVLYSYGWVDQKAGTVHIPIQRAIDLVAQKGLPASPAAAATPTDNGETIPSYSSSGTQPVQVLH